MREGLTVSSSSRQARGALPALGHKGPTPNGTQGLQGEADTPASFRGLVHRTCTSVTGALGGQTPAEGLCVTWAF